MDTAAALDNIAGDSIVVAEHIVAAVVMAVVVAVVAVPVTVVVVLDIVGMLVDMALYMDNIFYIFFSTILCLTFLLPPIIIFVMFYHHALGHVYL